MRFDSVLNHPLLKAALFPVLWPASLLYGAGALVDRRRSLRSRTRLPIPTISVGNLTVGGTGKTPVVLRLLGDLMDLNRRPVVLTRGYAGVGRGRAEGVVRGPAGAAGFSDEVALMAERCPSATIVAAADRAAAGARAIEESGGDVAVLDDGFQHWPLERDLDVVCVDATDPWGGGLLPLGRLREPASGLSRAGLVLMTRCERVDEETALAIAARAARLAPGADILRTRFSLELSAPDGAPAAVPARVVAASGIGNPAAFEANIAAMGADVSAARFPDHHAYTQRDADALSARAAADRPVVVTEKDWMKLRTLNVAAPVLIARQTLHFDDGAQAIWRRRVAAAVAPR